jgi:hypothetical protein
MRRAVLLAFGRVVSAVLSYCSFFYNSASFHLQNLFLEILLNFDPRLHNLVNCLHGCLKVSLFFGFPLLNVALHIRPVLLDFVGIGLYVDRVRGLTVNFGAASICDVGQRVDGTGRRQFTVF